MGSMRREPESGPSDQQLADNERRYRQEDHDRRWDEAKVEVERIVAQIEDDYPINSVDEDRRTSPIALRFVIGNLKALLVAEMVRRRNAVESFEALGREINAPTAGERAVS